MPRLNIYHDIVLAGLRADGWAITDVPLFLPDGERRTLIGADKGGERIALTVHEFLGPSPACSLQSAVGQWLVERALLQEVEPDRRLLLAVPLFADGILREPLGQLVLHELAIDVVVFDPETGSARRWIDARSHAVA